MRKRSTQEILELVEELYRSWLLVVPDLVKKRENQRLLIKEKKIKKKNLDLDRSKSKRKARTEKYKSK